MTNKPRVAAVSRRLTSRRTHEALVEAVDAAQVLPEFGRRLLASGKGPDLQGARREAWLCDRVASALVRAGFRCTAEELLDDRKRVDIAVWEPGGSRMACAIESKVYFTHHSRPDGGHRFLRNTCIDFRKRLGVAPRQQAIVFAIEYAAMGTSERMLYQAGAIRRALELGRVASLARFEHDLRETFAPICTVYPSRRARNPSWSVEYEGATASLRAWVLSLCPGVSVRDLANVLESMSSAAAPATEASRRR